MKEIKEFEHESWGWFIDLESNKNNEIFKKKFENYNYLIKKSKCINSYLIVYNLIGTITIIYIMFSIFKI